MDQWHLNAEKPNDETKKIHQEDATSRSGYAQLKVLGSFNDSLTIRHEKCTECAERKKDRLANNPRILLLEDKRDAS